MVRDICRKEIGDAYSQQRLVFTAIIIVSWRLRMARHAASIKLITRAHPVVVAHAKNAEHRKLQSTNHLLPTPELFSLV